MDFRFVQAYVYIPSGEYKATMIAGSGIQKSYVIGNFEVPTSLPGVNAGILDPRDTYASAAEWEVKAKDLAERFQKNFVKYCGNEAGKALVAAGPQL